MGKPAARVGDMHTCPMSDGPKPHVGGPVLPAGEPTVLIEGMAAARVGDQAQCAGPSDVIVTGSPTVIIGGRPAARMGDSTAHGGVIVGGTGTVIIGESGSTGGTAVAVVEAGDSYGQAIKIGGSEEFRERTVGALTQIERTPSGKKLLEDLDNSGKTVTIKETSGGNEVTDFSDEALVKEDGTHGTGSDSTVYYNPDRRELGKQNWETRPPAVGLAHELIHAQHAAEGTIDPKKVDNDKKPDSLDSTKIAQARAEEVRTVGVDPYSNEPYSENTIRSEWEPKQPGRPWY